MPKPQEFLIGGEPETEEEQRLRFLELVLAYFQERFGTPDEDETAETLEQKEGVPLEEPEQPGIEQFSFSSMDLPEVSLEGLSSEQASDENPKNIAGFNGPRPRTQEEINRDLERLGLSVQIFVSEKDRLNAEIDTWLAFNRMAPRTALNYVEELVRELREKQVDASEPEVRKHLWERTLQH